MRLAAGDDLYRYGGESYPPSRNTGPAPECRIEVSPSRPATTDYFLHVLTATDAETAAVPQAAVQVAADEVTATVGNTTLRFTKARVGGSIERNGRRIPFAEKLPASTGQDNPQAASK